MRNQEKWDRVIRSSTIKRLFPPRLARDLQTYPTPDLPQIQSGLYIYGPAGSGKTTLSAFILLEQCRQWYLQAENNAEAKFVSVPEMFQELKDSFGKDPAESERQIIDRYRNYNLLVLDDFGVSKPSDWILQTTYLIINHRYEHLLPTIFTANNSLEDIAELYGDDRITSRIERMCQVKRKFKL